MRSALILGIAGQDGSYLAEQLLGMGYQVHGMLRRSSSLVRSRLDHLGSDRETRFDRLRLHYGDVTDAVRLQQLIRQTGPDEIYNLAAQSHVVVSFDEPLTTLNTNAVGALHVLEAVRATDPSIRLFQAGSSEMFRATPKQLDVDSLIAPANPYGLARAAAFLATRMYREIYGMYAVTGVLFNHESPRRSENFVTRKVSRGVARILRGEIDHIDLGDISAKRDWGYAPEFTDAMWRMLQIDTPHDLVLATGVLTSVEEFVDFAFSSAGLNWKEHVRFDESLKRIPDPVDRRARTDQALEVIEWRAQTSARELAAIMVDADVQNL